MLHYLNPVRTIAMNNTWQNMVQSVHQNTFRNSQLKESINRTRFNETSNWYTINSIVEYNCSIFCSFFSVFFLPINHSQKYWETLRKEGRVGSAYLAMRSLDIRFHVAGCIEWSVNGKCVIAIRVVCHPPFFRSFPSLSFGRFALLMGRPNFAKIQSLQRGKINPAERRFKLSARFEQ